LKKVLLVNANLERAPYPVPPLGLALVAEGLAAAGYVPRLFDGAFADPAALPAVARDFQPDYVGLGVRNIDDVVMDGTTCYVDGIRDKFIGPLRAATAAPLILGGAGFSIFPVPLMDLLAADYGLVGEGERRFPELLRALDAGEPVDGLPGVVCRGKAGGKSSLSARQPIAGGDTGAPRASQPPSLSAFQPIAGGDTGAPRASQPLVTPFANLDRWIDFAPYRARGAYPIQTKRGCAHECLYCSYAGIEGPRYRLRDPAAVVDEMSQAQQRLGSVMFEFVDSTFNDPPEHALAVCREITARGLEFRLRTMGVNPARLSAALIHAMREAGFVQMDCTPDSASPSMLDRLRKNFSLADLERAARCIRDAQLPTMWFFLFGGPGENEQTVRETFAFVDRCIEPLDMVHMTAGLRIYPGTGLHRVALQEGIVDASDDLLRPRFYVSPQLGKDRLRELLADAAARRPNCVPADESSPPPEMLREAALWREKEGLTEPMFRTLLRVRRRKRE